MLGYVAARKTYEWTREDIKRLKEAQEVATRALNYDLVGFMEYDTNEVLNSVKQLLKDIDRNKQEALRGK